MKTSARIITIAMLLVLTACNMPGAATSTGPSVEQQAATIVAATMKAVTGPLSTTAATTPFASPAVPPATPTIKPTLSINADNSVCRSGPGADFKVVATFPAGTTVDLIGKDTADSYWIVQDPASHDLCWIQAQFATPGGSFTNIPEITPEAATVGLPSRPGSLSYNFFCDNSSLTTTVSWTDTANNENGYRVFRNGNQVADLPANSTSFNEKVPYTLGTQETYTVIAYNDAGASDPRSTPPFSCQ